MESTMSTATQTRTARLMSAEQLREQQETSGREGLASLLKAVRRMLDWLLMPFRIVGRVLFKPRLAVADNAAPASTSAAPRDAAFANASLDEQSLSSPTDGASTGHSDDHDLGGLMRHVAENPDGSLDVELTGAPDDLDVVVPMLMRHIDQILKTHLPSDAQEAQVATHLVALAETAECARYAHRLVSWQVDGVMKAVLADPKYVGLSATTIEGMIRSAAQSPDAAAAFGDGSAEQRLLARLAVRDKIESDYALQMRQMAVALAPMLGDAKSSSEMVGRGKELLASAIQAAQATSVKLRVRQAAVGAVRILHETLPPVQDGVDQAIASVAQSLEAKSAAVMAPVADSGASEILVTDAEVSSDLEGLSKASPAESVVTAAATPAAPTQAAAPASAPAPAPAPKVAEAAKAAVAAVQAVRAGGMFGGVATVQRSAAELEAANMVDEVNKMDVGLVTIT
jgi:hypothetical protein